MKCFGKTGGNVAYHAYQGFATGAVTPDEAHAIGVQLARELWGVRFQMLVATHTNSHCVQNYGILITLNQRNRQLLHRIIIQ